MIPQCSCTSRRLSHTAKAEASKALGMPMPLFAWGHRNNFYEPGRVFRYIYLDRYDVRESLMRQAMDAYEAVIDVQYIETDDIDESDIRITFDDRLGSWSYVGKDNDYIHPEMPTMNIGWDSLPTSMHELGHQLGLGHEHQNPSDSIQWNKAQVYADLMGPPNNWTKEQVDWNMFRMADRDQTNYTAFDPKSIMLYPFDASWTMDGFSTDYNKELSSTDITFLKEIYGSAEKVEDPAGDEIARLITTIFDQRDKPIKSLQRNYRDTLKTICRLLNIDDSGTRRGDIADRIWKHLQL